MEHFCERLRELRGAKSQAEIARLLGVKQQNWARWENDVVTPSAEMIAKICRVHACSADWLLGLKGEGSETPKLPAAKATSPAPASPPAPGDRPDCAGCPYREKMKEFEALCASMTPKKGKKK